MMDGSIVLHSDRNSEIAIATTYVCIIREYAVILMKCTTLKLRFAFHVYLIRYFGVISSKKLSVLTRILEIISFRNWTADLLYRNSRAEIINPKVERLFRMAVINVNIITTAVINIKNRRWWRTSYLVIFRVNAAKNVRII